MRWSKPLSALVALVVALAVLGSAVRLVDTTLGGGLALRSVVVTGVVVVVLLLVVAVGVGHSRFLDSAHYW